MDIWEYLEDFKLDTMQNKSLNTCNSYLYDLKLFAQYLKKDILEIKQIDIEKYKNNLRDTVKPKTINRKLTSIKRFIDFLNKNKNTKIQVNFKLLKVQKQEYLNETLELSDYERLLRHAEKANDKRAIAIFCVLYHTGVRVSELLSFNMKMIDKKEIEVLGKGDKYRTVLLSNKIIQPIKNYVTERKHGNNSPLFINKKNDNRMDRQAIHRLIKKYAGKSKVKSSKAHAHNFRHLYALQLIDEGAKIEEVADLLGHNDLNTTRIYTKKTKEKLHELVNRL